MFSVQKCHPGLGQFPINVLKTGFSSTAIQLNKEIAEKTDASPASQEHSLTNESNDELHLMFFVTPTSILFYDLFSEDFKEHRPYSPHQVPLKLDTLGEYAVARIDDLISMGRKV